MDTITIYDGLILTLVAMLVVFIVLASIWGLVELVAKFTPSDKPLSIEVPMRQSTLKRERPDNPQHKKVAEVIALVLASEDQHNKKFEIVESKRIR